MATQAKEVFTRVQLILQDKTAVRWSIRELRLWANDGLREIVSMKPSANPRTVILSLAAGTKQEIPNSAIALIRVIRNMSNATTNAIGRAAIITVPREVMDSQSPDWHDPDVYPPEKRVTHAVYDPEDQRHFYVWPPNNGDGYVEALVSRYPNEIPSASPPEKLDSYTSVVDLQDIYINALIDYVLYRAYLKDNDVSGNPERAMAHYTAMANSLGVKVKNELGSNPNTTAAATRIAT